MTYCNITLLQHDILQQYVTYLLQYDIFRAGQVRKLVRRSANPQLRTNEKNYGRADIGSLNCGLAVADYF